MKTSKNVFVVAIAAMVLSCGGGLKGLPGGDALDQDLPEKYEAYFDKCEQFEKDIDEAKTAIDETPGELAATLGLEEGATLEEIGEAIKSRLQDEVIKAGAHVEVTIEGGVSASAMAEAGTGGASAGASLAAEVKVEIKVVGEIEISEGLQELIDAGQVALQRIATVTAKLKAIADQAPELIEEGAELAASAKDDVPAAALPQVTKKIAGYKDMLGEVKGMFDVSFEMQVTIEASFSAEASTG
jgi:hypothetical protein